MTLTFEKLMQNLHDRKFAPIYLLHGEEAWFIDQIADYIEANVLTDAEKSFNQQIIYARDIDAVGIANACMRYPMMSERQVIILKEAQTVKDWDYLQTYFEKPVPTTMLVICHKYKNFDKRTKVYKAVEANATVFESKRMDEKKLPDWIVAQLKLHKRNIKPQAAMLMAEHLGSNLENINNAISKLAMAKSEGASIDEKDIEEHVGISREYNIWELNSALGKKDMKKLAKLAFFITTHSKEMPMPIITATLFGFFAKVAIAQQGKEALQKAGINDFMARDLIAAAGHYKGKIKQVMDILLEYDLRFKGVDDTGTPEPELTKEMLYRIAFI